MLFSDFKVEIHRLGFKDIQDFLDYVGVNSNDVSIWEVEKKVPKTIKVIIDLLKKEQNITSSTIDNIIEECLPLAELLDEASQFPNIIEEMFLLQKKLNDDTNGKNWELGINKYHKDINWIRCIYMEVSELIDSTPWKHWKNIHSDIDLENVHIEIVDIWHFLMSYILQETNIPKAVKLVTTHCIYEAINEVNYKDIIHEAEKLSYIALAIETKNMPVFAGIERFVEQFFRLAKISGLSFVWLHKLYIGKNTLNKLRQEHGYKEGTYQKIWNGKEDNTYLTAILNEDINITFDSLYEKLLSEYEKAIC